MAVITTEIRNQCLHNRKRPNYTKFSRYVHSVVTCGTLSGIVLPLALIPCLLGWIQLFFPCSQITLTCLIRVAVERKTTISNENLREVLAINTSKSYRIIHNSLVLCFDTKLTEQANLTYVNIVEDIGAAVGELKLVWNRPKEFGNVIIHPGDFHITKNNFQVNMDSYVFSFIRFLFNIACCSQK